MTNSFKPALLFLPREIRDQIYIYTLRNGIKNLPSKTPKIDRYKRGLCESDK